MKQTTKDIVLTFISALNKEDFEAAAACLADDMAFDGVMGKRDSAESYIADMKKMKFKYDIQKTFEDENDVCVLYNIDMSGEATIFTCGWYHLSNGKIDKLKVVFDPRPLLEGSGK
nr:nuclear transport factor 2 family protein [uncultured Mucilaginibacter sp.]